MVQLQCRVARATQRLLSEHDAEDLELETQVREVLGRLHRKEKKTEGTSGFDFMTIVKEANAQCRTQALRRAIFYLIGKGEVSYNEKSSRYSLTSEAPYVAS